MSSSGLADFQLSYQLSPIIFVGGIAADLPNSQLPIIALTESASFEQGILDGELSIDPSDFFANFTPLSGGQLVNNTIGTYPFANQTVAANAIITQPLVFSILMICPAKAKDAGYISKQQIMTSLKQSIDQHNNLGGTYTVATPAFLYDNCVLLNLEDVTGGESHQVQYAYRWNFMKPLITQEDAQLALNNLMAKLNGGLPTTPNDDGEITWSGPSSIIAPINGAVQGVVSSLNLSGTLSPVLNNISAINGTLNSALNTATNLRGKLDSALNTATTFNFNRFIP